MANGVVPVLPDHSGFSESLRSLREPLGDSFVDSITMPSNTTERVSGLHAVLNNLMGSLSDVRGLTPKLRKLAVARYDWNIRCMEMANAYREVARPEQRRGRHRSSSSEHAIDAAQAKSATSSSMKRQEERTTKTTVGSTGEFSLQTMGIVAGLSLGLGVLLAQCMRK